MDKATIEAGRLDHTILIRISGRADFQVSACLKEFFTECLRQGIEDFALDIKGCASMDSTFMGVLAGMAVELRNRGKRRLTLIHVDKHNYTLLETLGIHMFINILSKPIEAGTQLTALPEKHYSHKALAENMLKAHEVLMDLSESNRIQFKDVVDFIREDLRRKASEEPSS